MRALEWVSVAFQLLIRELIYAPNSIFFFIMSSPAGLSGSHLKSTWLAALRLFH